MSLRFLTAGETHGPQLTAIIEGMPSNMTVNFEQLNEHLLRRQKGYGRGRRMQIETDTAQIVGGVRHGRTTGAPIALVVENKDWKHWTSIMNVEPIEGTDEEKRRVHRPRPGHADLNGGLKYNLKDLRNVLERSSARETAARVACGALARQLLEQFGIKIAGHVIRIGEIEAPPVGDISIDELIERTEQSSVRVVDEETEKKMEAYIDQIKKEGDSIGGIVECIVEGLPVGLGSHVQYDRKLDGRIAQGVMSINAFKGVEIGIGFEAGILRGSQVHDEIEHGENGYTRSSNRLGGFEGGMTNGMPVVVRGVMKPIPTLYKPLRSVDIDTKEAFTAQVERSDACAVPAASVVMEHVVAWEVAKAFLEKFGGDSMEEIRSNYENYLNQLAQY
ncbi:chorismate synthase [Paenibacillus sp. SC116]|uniref:chorismate synthase n=1 Tax=Paenibacillus sp. SC116 TaxID=2968986 RepID=UPI00215A8F0C|nr:chorismate synthase [Paenibacillus sp. SC116]MCR8842959.1 chorismate synthase [Paenibacillus sp. SC116]